MPRYIQWETSDIHVPWGLEADSKVFPVSVGDNEQLDARSATVHLSVFRSQKRGNNYEMLLYFKGRLRASPWPSPLVRVTENNNINKSRHSSGSRASVKEGALAQDSGRPSQGA